MDIGKYFELLKVGKKEDAEKVRIATIPNKLIKFVSLQGDGKDENKFKSLEHNQIWISNVRKMNDPYEFKGLILDEHKFEEVGYPRKTIEKFKTIFEMEDIGITSLSGNNIDYLPMLHSNLCMFSALLTLMQSKGPVPLQAIGDIRSFGKFIIQQLKNPLEKAMSFTLSSGLL